MDESKIWCINNENVLLKKNMDYHGIFPRIILYSAWLGASELVSERLILLIKVNIPFFYSHFLGRLKNDLLTCIPFPRHKMSLKPFGERTIGSVLRLIFLSSVQCYGNEIQRELAFGSLKSPPLNGIVKRNPFGVGVLAWKGWCGLAEQQLPCANYMWGGVEHGALQDLRVLGFGDIFLAVSDSSKPFADLLKVF